MTDWMGSTATWQLLANVSQAIGLPIAAVLLYLTWRSLRRTALVEEAQLWVESRRLLTEYHDVHTALAPGGGWHKSSGFPASAADLRRLEAYMGILEHCKIMIDSKLLSWPTFVAVYKYRLSNLASNPYICQAKLIKAAKDWAHLNELLRACDIPVMGASLPSEQWPKKSLADAVREAESPR